MDKRSFGLLVIVLTAALLLPGWQQHAEQGAQLLDAAFADLPAPASVSGTIYYTREGEPAGMWCLEADGRVHELFAGELSGEPSRELHNGQRWFVTSLPVAGEFFGDGSPRTELYVFSEDGTMVTLCNCRELQVSPFTLRWIDSDRAVAWIGRRLDCDGNIIDGGIYESRIPLDESDNLIDSPETPQAPRIRLDLVVDDWRGELRGLVPDVWSFDYSPDGKNVVYETMRQRLYVHEFAGGDARLLTESMGCDPVWSRDGSVILFRLVESFGAIACIRPDGGDQSEVVRGLPGNYVVTRPVAGPDGRFAYARTQYQATDVCLAVHLLVHDLQSSADTAAVVGLPPRAVPLAWR
jgi:hypothetical protein